MVDLIRKVLTGLYLLGIIGFAVVLMLNHESRNRDVAAEPNSLSDWRCCHYAKDGQVKCKPVTIITVKGRGLPIAQLGVLRYDDTWWERAKGYYRFYPDNFRKACSWDDAR